MAARSGLYPDPNFKDIGMREKVVNHIKQLLATDGEFDEDYEDLLDFAVPETDADIEALTDEQLIKLLEIYGSFTG